MPTSCFLPISISFLFLSFFFSTSLASNAPLRPLPRGRPGLGPVGGEGAEVEAGGSVLYECRRLLSANNLQSRDDDEEPRRLEGGGVQYDGEGREGEGPSQGGGGGGFRVAGAAVSRLFLLRHAETEKPRRLTTQDSRLDLQLRARDSRLATYLLAIHNS